VQQDNFEHQHIHSHIKDKKCTLQCCTPNASYLRLSLSPFSLFGARSEVPEQRRAGVCVRQRTCAARARVAGTPSANTRILRKKQQL
jgi:hypothetical protein